MVYFNLQDIAPTEVGATHSLFKPKKTKRTNVKEDKVRPN
jgi:hypothetical protein